MKIIHWHIIGFLGSLLLLSPALAQRNPSYRSVKYGYHFKKTPFSGQTSANKTPVSLKSLFSFFLSPNPEQWPLSSSELYSQHYRDTLQVQKEKNYPFGLRQNSPCGPKSMERIIILSLFSQYLEPEESSTCAELHKSTGMGLTLKGTKSSHWKYEKVDMLGAEEHESNQSKLRKGSPEV